MVILGTAQECILISNECSLLPQTSPHLSHKLYLKFQREETLKLKKGNKKVMTSKNQVPKSQLRSVEINTVIERVIAAMK